MQLDCITSIKKNSYYSPIRVNTRLVPRLVTEWWKLLDMTTIIHIKIIFNAFDNHLQQGRPEQTRIRYAKGHIFIDNRYFLRYNA